jgi:two-component system OmpR family response regulator
VTFDPQQGGQSAVFAPAGKSQHGGVENATVPEPHAGDEPIRVLVAESDANIRSVLSWALSHDDRFTVVATVADGDAALTCKQNFDVALVDLGIHGRGGFGTIANLHQRVPAPAVVVLSSVDAVYLRHAAAAEGAVDFVVIADGLDHLGDRLQTAGRRSRTAAAAP